MRDFDGKIVLVTGASTGLGAALAVGAAVASASAVLLA
jgi:NAD(P)-dependent dehydrogenase (short-subunit alcohol dehydrogenase family)